VTVVDPLLEQIADRLQDWQRGLDTLGASEVLAWRIPDGYGSVAIAFRGDPLRIELRSFRPEEGIDNNHHYLDLTLQQALGLKAKPVYWEGTRHVVGVRGGAGQLMTGGYTHIGEVVDGIQMAVAAVIELQTGEEPPDVRVALMPKQGEPWEYDEDETIYYNAKRKQWFFTPRPEFLVKVEVRDPQTSEQVEAIGADMCKIMGVVEGEPSDQRFLSMRLPLIEPDILVTHSFGFERGQVGAQAIAAFIGDCGGLLFPSLAVGHLPGATFGPICFVMDPRLVLEAMRPYKRGRGAWPIVTYDGDAWTATMGEFLGSGAVEMYEQLTGKFSPGVYGTPHFWVLGPPVREDGGGSAASEVIKTTTKLRAELRRRVLFWYRDLPPDEIEEIAFGELTTLRYPYLEAKTNSVVAMSNVAACVFPEEMSTIVVPFLRAINFDGIGVPLDATYDRGAALMKYGAMYEWSWAVQDAVRAMGRSFKVEI
jgi:hypothetical protein